MECMHARDKGTRAAQEGAEDREHRGAVGVQERGGEGVGHLGGGVFRQADSIHRNFHESLATRED